MRETPTKTYYWYQFYSQTVAWQHGCHGNRSRQSCVWVCVYCTGGLSMQWKTDTVFCVWLCVSVCLLGRLWDTVRRELCWLVEGPGGQKGNNTNSFPSLFPPCCLCQLQTFFSECTTSLSSSPSTSPLSFWFEVDVMRSDWGTTTSLEWPRGTNMLPRVPALLTGGTSPANMITVPLLLAGQQPAETMKCRSN